MYHGRRQLTNLAADLLKHERGHDDPELPYSADVQRLLSLEHDTSELLKLDFETLYVVGGILLDQWALIALSLEPKAWKRNHPFVELYMHLESEDRSRLSPIWDHVHEHLIWLHYNMRFYRNRFIVHANRPWQRGTARSVIGDDFRLHTPTPPGWLDDTALDEEIIALLDFAPEAIRDAPEGNRERTRPASLINQVFENIPNIRDRKDRERVASVFGRKGGSTPSFQLLAHRLGTLMSEGTSTLTEIARTDLTRVDLGPPFETSKEMLLRWRKRD